MTIEERFEKLENQNRKLRKWVACIGAIAVMALVGGTALSVRAYTATIEPASITTQSITIKDSAGKTRAMLTSGGAFFLFDANGKQRTSVDSNGIFVSYDAAGKQRAAMTSGGYVTTHDWNGAPRVRLNGNDNKIYFYNASGGTVAAHP